MKGKQLQEIVQPLLAHVSQPDYSFSNLEDFDWVAHDCGSKLILTSLAEWQKVEVEFLCLYSSLLTMDASDDQKTVGRNKKIAVYYLYLQLSDFLAKNKELIFTEHNFKKTTKCFNEFNSVQALEYLGKLFPEIGKLFPEIFLKKIIEYLKKGKPQPSGRSGIDAIGTIFNDASDAIIPEPIKSIIKQEFDEFSEQSDIKIFTSNLIDVLVNKLDGLVFDDKNKVRKPLIEGLGLRLEGIDESSGEFKKSLFKAFLQLISGYIVQGVKSGEDEVQVVLAKQFICAAMDRVDLMGNKNVKQTVQTFLDTDESCKQMLILVGSVFDGGYSNTCRA
jgi:hypothetical protein